MANASNKNAGNRLAKSVLVIWWPLQQEQTALEEAGRVPQVRYALCGPLGHRLSAGTESLNRLPKDTPCLVLLPSSEVSLLAVAPPKLSGKKLKDALPFLVEPLLLNEPEENFVSLWPALPHNTEGEQLAAVVSKTRIRSVVAACRQHGLVVAGISSEALMQPADNATWMWLSGRHLMLVDGKKPPLALDLGQPSLVGALLQKRLALATFGVWMPEECKRELENLRPQLGASLDRLNELSSPGRTLKNEQLNYSTLLKRPLVNGDDLRKMGLKSSASGASRWGTLTVPALVFSVIGLAGLNIWALKVSAQERALEESMAKTYSQSLPNTPMVADPLLLIEREIKSLSSGSQNTNSDGISYVLHEIGLSLESAPFNSMQDIHYEPGKLVLKFGANIEERSRSESVQRLKAKNIVARWAKAEGGQATALEVDWGMKK